MERRPMEARKAATLIFLPACLPSTRLDAPEDTDHGSKLPVHPQGLSLHCIHLHIPSANSSQVDVKRNEAQCSFSYVLQPNWALKRTLSILSMGSNAKLKETHGESLIRLTRAVNLVFLSREHTVQKAKGLAAKVYPQIIKANIWY